MFDLLSVEEAKQANRYRFAASKRQFVPTYGLARMLAAELLHCPLDALNYESQNASRFFVRCAGQHLTCAVAWSGERAVIAFIADGTVGVDVKQMESDPYEPAIIARYFTKREQQLLAQFPPALRTAIYFQYLSRKSAWCKATDERNPPDLNTLDVAPAEHGMQELADDSIDITGWRILSLSHTPGYAIALATNAFHAPLRQIDLTPTSLFTNQSTQSSVIGWVNSGNNGR